VVELARAQREKRDAVTAGDPAPANATESVWGTASQMATVGIFVFILVGCLYFGRPVLLPIVAAILIGTTLAPLVAAASRVGLPPWATATVLVVLMMAVAIVAVTLLAGPITEWVGKGPEIAATIKQQLTLFDRPLAALQDLEHAVMPAAPSVAVESSKISMLTPVVAFVTPAVAESILFFATLIFYLAGEREFHRQFAGFFETREGKLRFIRIANDIKENLASYVAVVTLINAALGTIVAIGAWLIGLPSPPMLGALAMLFNYIPYIGPAAMALTLFAVGIVTFGSLTQALIAPAALVVLTTLEGHLITPTVLGRRLTLNPFAVFLAIAFWAWLWGPMGAFLAVPLLIVGMVVFEHLFPSDDVKLPG
jgi:predicted PurR-regulated permease PerM